MINKNARIFLAGHKGMVGAAVLKIIKKKKYKNILIVEKKKLDLRDSYKVSNFFKKNRIEAVIIAAAKVGGILANSKYKADFLYDNLAIQNNLIHSAFKKKIKNLIFLGSSCIYPKKTKQPIKESYLLDGKLEPTNEPYAIAKIAGLKLCESYNYQYKTNYKCLMPCNLYGPNDNYNLHNSHFFSALIKKIYLAKKFKKNSITLWGNKNTKRELMFVDDLADAIVYFLNKKTKETLINIGSGKEMRIIDYAKFISKKLKVKLKIFFDQKMPSGMSRKIIDSNIAKKYGWTSATNLNDGFDLTLKDFENNLKKKKYLE